VIETTAPGWVRGGVEWRRGTVYNGGEIQGGFADEI